MDAKQATRLGTHGLGTALVCALVALGAAAAAASQDGAGKAAPPQMRGKAPIASVLRSDGSLDPSSNYQGPLDVKGYQMVTGPNGQPRFVSGATPGPIPPSTPGPESDPSDVYWDDQFPMPGPDNGVGAAITDGLGNLYVGGAFTFVGSLRVNYIAKWDGASWSALGSGTNGGVSRLALDASGNLYAAGAFTTAGGVNANRIAVWDGSSWSALGSGLDGPVGALETEGTGNVYACVYHYTSEDGPTGSILRWNGSTWSILGTANGDISALALDGNGNLCAGGYFDTVGGVSAQSVAKWDGASWSALGSGISGRIYALAVDASGNLYAGGYFTDARNYAKWDGTSWSISTFMPPANYGEWEVDSILTHGDSVILSGIYYWTVGDYYYYSNGFITHGWPGALWRSTDDTITVLAADDNTIYAGGVTECIDGASIAKYDGWNWSTLGSGWTPGETSILDLGARGDHLFLAGEFSIGNESEASQVAEWDGSTWSSLGSASYFPLRLAMAITENSVYLGGDFSSVSGVLANGVARYDGLGWSPLGEGISGVTEPRINAFAKTSSSLYAAGKFAKAGDVYTSNIARWDGSSWSALGDGVAGGQWDAQVHDLALDANGNLYAGGWFWMFGDQSVNHIAKWDGSSWSPLGSGMDSSVKALVTNGTDLYAGGHFTGAGDQGAAYIAKWDGSSWSPLGSGMGGGTYGYYRIADVNDLAVDGSGNLYAGGYFTIAGGVPTNYIARWDGSTWSALGSGVSNHVSHTWSSPSKTGVGAVQVCGNCLYVGGDFTHAGNKVSSCFAMWQPRVNVSQGELTAVPGVMTIGDNVYGFYKPALMTGSGTTVSYAGGMPAAVTLDRAPEICVGGVRVNGAFTFLPAGFRFGGEGAVLRVEFSEDDVTSWPGYRYTDFRAVQLTYPTGYPVSKEAAAVTQLSNNMPAPIRIENERQIYAITLPVTEIGGAYGAVPFAQGPTADLSLTKVSLPPIADIGQNVVYRLTVTNMGPDASPLSAANNVVVTDQLPSPVAFVSATASQGSVSFAGGLVTAQLGTLAAGASATVDITVTALAAGSADNTASVVADEPDPVPGNNQASATTTILPDTVDLALTKVSMPETTTVGQSIVYRLTVTNTEADTGPASTAHNVVVTDQLPSLVGYVSATASQGSVSFAGGVVTAQLGTLAAGASATVDITVTALAAGSAENAASAAADEPDPVPANNEAHAGTTIVAGSGPDLAGSLSGVSQTCRTTRRGTSCRLRGNLDISNIGNALAGGSTVTFYLSTQPQLTPGASVLKTQSVGQLRPGSHARVRLSATLPTGQTATGAYLVAVLDSGGVLAEMSETNNIVLFGPIP